MTSCNIVRVFFLAFPLVALLPYMGDCRHFRPVWSRTSKRLIEPETEIYSPFEMSEDDQFTKRHFESSESSRRSGVGLSEYELEMAREIEDKLERAQQRQQEEEEEEKEEEAVKKRNYWDDEEDEDEDEYEYDNESPLEAEREEEEEEENMKKRMLGNWNQMKHYPHRLHSTD